MMGINSEGRLERVGCQKGWSKNMNIILIYGLLNDKNFEKKQIQNHLYIQSEYKRFTFD